MSRVRMLMRFSFANPSVGPIFGPIVMMLFLIGCNTGKVTLDRIHEDFDARFVSEVYSWNCQQGESEYLVGVFGHSMHFYYAPSGSDDLYPLDGCVYSRDMFPIGAGTSASSLDGLIGYPSWELLDSEGHLQSGSMEGGFGYWTQEVMTDEHTCLDPTGITESQITLKNALGFSDSRLPKGFDVPLVFSTSPTNRIDFGEQVEISWENNQWSRIWINFRRFRNGDLFEILSCPITEGTSFLIDTPVWEMFSDGVSNNPDEVEFWLGFEQREMQRSQGGDTIELLNRAIAIPTELP